MAQNMDDRSAPQVPLMIINGIRSEKNDGVAIMRIDQIKNYPFPLALTVLLEALEKGRRSEPVNAAARNAAAWIIEGAQGTEKMEMIGKVLSCSEKTSNGIMILLSKEAKKLALASPALGIREKAALIRKSEADTSYELLELLRISSAPDRFEVIRGIAGEATKDEALRVRGMRELASFGNESAIGFFESALGNESPILRNEAILGLVSLWTEDSENAVERILCAHLEKERVQGLKINLVQWIGENGRHAVSKKALLKVLAGEEDQRLLSIAEKAADELGRRLEARPLKFQSGAGAIAVTLAPDECGAVEAPSREMPEDSAEVAEESLSPEILGLAKRLETAREPGERIRLARALAMIAKMTMDRAEAEAVLRILENRGREEFAKQIAGVREKIEGLKGAQNIRFEGVRPSKRPTPDKGLERPRIPAEAKRSPQLK
jgi:hypothetical protein